MLVFSREKKKLNILKMLMIPFAVTTQSKIVSLLGGIINEKKLLQEC